MKLQHKQNDTNHHNTTSFESNKLPPRKTLKDYNVTKPTENISTNLSSNQSALVEQIPTDNLKTQASTIDTNSLYYNKMCVVVL